MRADAAPTDSDPQPVVDMAELGPYASHHRLTDVTAGDDHVVVTWADGRNAVLHHLWLRDHCPCRHCRHPGTRERIVNLIDRMPVPAPSAAITPQGALALTWPESEGPHESLFDPGWLRQQVRPGAVGARTFWDATAMPAVPRVDWQAVMTTEDGLHRWLGQLRRYGLAVLTDGPEARGSVVRAAERLGWARETNFGRVFDVVSKPDPNNAAYTAMRLEPHVDLPNWQRPPDYQFLYCLANAAQGGESLFVDGFAVAEALRAEDPAAYETLAANPIDFRFQDTESDIACRAPVIGRDADGTLAEIRFNNWIRDRLRLPESVVPDFYRGYLRYWQLLRDPRFMIRLTLNPGEMVAFDNLRVLHGREAFDPNTGHRHLQGCYVDRDLVASRLAVLARAGAPA